MAANWREEAPCQDVLDSDGAILLETIWTLPTFGSLQEIACPLCEFRFRLLLKTTY